MHRQAFTNGLARYHSLTSEYFQCELKFLKLTSIFTIPFHEVTKILFDLWHFRTSSNCHYCTGFFIFNIYIPAWKKKSDQEVKLNLTNAFEKKTMVILFLCRLKFSKQLSYKSLIIGQCRFYKEKKHSLYQHLLTFAVLQEDCATSLRHWDLKKLTTLHLYAGLNSGQP